MDYESLRTFADTWGLVLLVVIFLAVLVYIFRRGSTERYKRAARIPMEAPEQPDRPDQTINDIKANNPDTRGNDKE